MKIRGRVDNNHKEIVDGLRQRGISVRSTAGLGQGFPDIICGYKGFNFLFEIKSDEKAKLTKAEFEFFGSWSGQVHRINNLDEAVKIINDKIYYSIKFC